MQIKSKTKIAFLIGVLILTAGVWVLNRFEKLVIYIPTQSVPTGFYFYDGKDVARGKIILFSTPEVVKKYNLEHHKSEGFEHFLKPILAIENDHLCFKDNQFLLNGEVFASFKKTDSNGNILPIWDECRKLTKDEVFVYSDRVSNSFDSRYYGPVKLSAIIGVFKKL